MMLFKLNKRMVYGLCACASAIVVETIVSDLQDFSARKRLYENFALIR